VKKSPAQFIETASDANPAPDKATMLSMKRTFPLSKVYGLLEPGPDHKGYGAFMVAGETIKLPSKMK
jgi:hypothetical protein